MNETDLAQVKEVLHATLDERTAIDYNSHRRHHDWVGLQIEKEERRIERKEAVIKQVMGWGIIVVLAGVGKAVYHFFIKNPQ